MTTLRAPSSVASLSLSSQSGFDVTAVDDDARSAQQMSPLGLGSRTSSRLPALTPTATPTPTTPQRAAASVGRHASLGPAASTHTSDGGAASAVGAGAGASLASATAATALPPATDAHAEQVESSERVAEELEQALLETRSRLQELTRLVHEGVRADRAAERSIERQLQRERERTLPPSPAAPVAPAPSGAHAALPHAAVRSFSGPAAPQHAAATPLLGARAPARPHSMRVPETPESSAVGLGATRFAEDAAAPASPALTAPALSARTLDAQPSASAAPAERSAASSARTGAATSASGAHAVPAFALASSQVAAPANAAWAPGAPRASDAGDIATPSSSSGEVSELDHSEHDAVAPVIAAVPRAARGVDAVSVEPRAIAVAPAPAPAPVMATRAPAFKLDTSEDALLSEYVHNAQNGDGRESRGSEVASEFWAMLRDMDNHISYLDMWSARRVELEAASRKTNVRETTAAEYYDKLIAGGGAAAWIGQPVAYDRDRELEREAMRTNAHALALQGSAALRSRASSTSASGGATSPVAESASLAAANATFRVAVQASARLQAHTPSDAERAARVHRSLFSPASPTSPTSAAAAEDGTARPVSPARSGDASSRSTPMRGARLLAHRSSSSSTSDAAAGAAARTAVTASASVDATASRTDVYSEGARRYLEARAASRASAEQSGGSVSSNGGADDGAPRPDGGASAPGATSPVVIRVRPGSISGRPAVQPRAFGDVDAGGSGAAGKSADVVRAPTTPLSARADRALAALRRTGGASQASPAPAPSRAVDVAPTSVAAVLARSRELAAAAAATSAANRVDTSLAHCAAFTAELSTRPRHGAAK